MKYYQYEEYVDCLNCSIDEEYVAYKNTMRPKGKLFGRNLRNPCSARWQIQGNRKCFHAHPIPWQELIDDDPE